MNKILLEIAEHLEKLGNKEIEPMYSTLGMCAEIETIVGRGIGCTISEVNITIDNIFEQWPKFSGSVSYPISVSGSGWDDFDILDNKWSGDTEYSALRLELCLFTAMKLRELL